MKTHVRDTAAMTVTTQPDAILSSRRPFTPAQPSHAPTPAMAPTVAGVELQQTGKRGQCQDLVMDAGQGCEEEFVYDSGWRASQCPEDIRVEELLRIWPKMLMLENARSWQVRSYIDTGASMRAVLKYILLAPGAVKKVQQSLTTWGCQSVRRQ